jgi:hypothetical protein
VSPSLILNSNKERKEGKWKGDHRPASLPLMAGGRSGAIERLERGKRQETEGDLIAESYCLNWLA